MARLWQLICGGRMLAFGGCVWLFSLLAVLVLLVLAVLLLLWSAACAAGAAGGDSSGSGVVLVGL